MARPDSQVAARPWRSRRGVGRSGAPRWHRNECSTTPPPPATLTLSPTLCNPSRTAAATYNAAAAPCQETHPESVPTETRSERLIATSRRAGDAWLTRSTYIGRRLDPAVPRDLGRRDHQLHHPAADPGRPGRARARLDRGPRWRADHRRHRPEEGLEREVRLRQAALCASTSTTGSTCAGRPGRLDRQLPAAGHPEDRRRHARGRLGCSACPTIIAFVDRHASRAPSSPGRDRRASCASSRRRSCCSRPSRTTCWRSS